MSFEVSDFKKINVNTLISSAAESVRGEQLHLKPSVSCDKYVWESQTLIWPVHEI